ncbi:MAG: hypothetical protein ACE14T_12850 [Syntrophales bacterium]
MEHEADYHVFWKLCDVYERAAGSRTALNNYLTAIFHKGANLDLMAQELKKTIRKLKGGLC